MRIHRRVGQPTRVIPDASEKMEKVLNNYADRIEKIFNQPSRPVDLGNPKPKVLTTEQEMILLASEQYMTRARILETGVAHVVGENYHLTTDVCMSVLQEALRLRTEARAMEERVKRVIV